MFDNLNEWSRQLHERGRQRRNRQRSEGIQRKEFFHADLISALSQAGHGPYVHARWVSGESGGSWSFDLRCSSCGLKRNFHWWPEKWRRLSPNKPCERTIPGTAFQYEPDSQGRAELSGKQVRAITFATALRGYLASDVDEMLERIAETLDLYKTGQRRTSEFLTADELDSCTFRTALRGYDLHDVDDFLDRVVAILRYHETKPAQPDSEPTPASSDSTPKRPEPDPPAGDISQDGDDEPDAESEEPRRTSEELLDQAKKWLDRS